MKSKSISSELTSLLALLILIRQKRTDFKKYYQPYSYLYENFPQNFHRKKKFYCFRTFISKYKSNLTGNRAKMQTCNTNIAQQQQELTQAISKINEAAYVLSQKKQFDVAIMKLKQGQQLLQYAAESCRNIRRELIVVILHNIVSLSQIKWDLSTASNYLEGLIYNFQITNSSKTNSRITVQDTPTSICLSEEETQSHSQLSEYYLQYCAINSQLRKHKNAQSAAKKGIRIIATLLRQSQWIKKAKNGEIHEYQIKRNILKYLLDHWESCLSDRDHTSNFIILCQNLWKGEIVTNKKSAMQAELRTFSIGNVMTLNYKHFKPQKNGDLYKKIHYNFILMSMALFSLATEVRFESSQKLNQAKHYHSLAILFYFIYIPFESPYIQHIKQNYLKNYGLFPNLQNSPLSNFTYKDLLFKIRRDSILQSSLNLQQESINSIQQKKRRNQRLRDQNLKLKMLCLAQIKTKRHPKSYQKAKSLTISHSNAKKISIDSKRNQRGNKNNKTNLHCIIKIDNYYNEKPHQQQKCKPQKQVLGNHNKDDMAEKYFEMAFKKNKMKSPAPKRRSSIRSTSSTTKDKSGNESKNAIKKSKEKISKITSRKTIKR